MKRNKPHKDLVFSDRVGEIWKDIKDYIGMYQVSNYGRVKSLPRIKKHTDTTTAIVKGRILKQFKAGKPKEYLHVGLCKNNQNRTTKVHQLVAEAFVSKRPSLKYEVNHKNGNKTDNTPTNLEWTTKKKNLEHAHKTGLMSYCPGELNGEAKLNETNVVEIIWRLKNGECGSWLAKEFKVDERTINRIRHNRSWTHLPR